MESQTTYVGKYSASLGGNIISTGGNVISVDMESDKNVTAMVRNMNCAHHQHYLLRSVSTVELKR